MLPANKWNSLTAALHVYASVDVTEMGLDEYSAKNKSGKVIKIRGGHRYAI